MIRFYGFDNSGRFCRELLRRINTTEMVRSNTKLDVDTQIASSPVEPMVTVTYEDKSEETFRPAPAYAPRMSADSILAAIAKKGRVMELHQVKPWDHIEWGRWGPVEKDDFPPMLRDLIDKGVQSK